MLGYRPNQEYPFYAQPTVPTPIFPEEQRRINVLCAEKNIEIGAAVTKEAYLNDVRVDLLRRKVELREYRKEMAKGNHLEISIGKNGELEAHIQNAFIKVPTRKVTNFRFADCYNLKSSSGEEGIMLLLLYSEDGRLLQIFLNLKKMGRMQYFEKKITEAGGVILANTRKERENILVSFWVEICGRSKGTVEIPIREGWISGHKPKYQFVERGEVLWAEIIKLAK